MGRSLNSPDAGRTITGTLMPYQGGTGKTTPSEALAALNGVPASSINQPNGIAGLDGSGKLPTSQLPVDNLSVVSLQGPLAIISGAVAQFQITNFDAFTNYDISVSGGSFFVSDDVLNFTAPKVDGFYQITINGRVFGVSVSQTLVAKPTIGVTSVGSDTGAAVVINGSSPVITGASTTHAATDWQVATDPAFSNIVSQSMANTTDKISWKSGNVNLSTTYYCRARYRSVGDSAVSAWSDVVQHTTRASYVITTEEAVLSAPTPTPSVGFGTSVSSNRDGTRIIVGAPGTSATTSITGTAYVFKRENGAWALEATLLPPTRAAGDRFGLDVAITADGDRAVVSASNTSSSTTIGSVYVYSRTGGTWALEAKLVGTNPASSYTFGASVALNAVGDMLLVGDTYVLGKVYTFERVGTTWTQTSSIAGEKNGAYYGACVSISGDGKRMATGAPLTDGADPETQGNMGKVFIYLRTGSTWTLEKSFFPPDSTTKEFARDVSLNFDGSKLVIGAPSYTATGTNREGGVLVYSRIGTNWTYEAVLQGARGQLNAGFGNSVAICDDGTKFIAGCADYPFNSRGAFFVYSKINGAWAKEIESFAVTNNDKLGFDVCISGDAGRVAAGAPQASQSTGSRVSVFK